MQPGNIRGLGLRDPGSNPGIPISFYKQFLNKTMIIREKDAYRQGDEVIYVEDEARMHVRILANRSDDQWIRYDVEVVRMEKLGMDHTTSLPYGYQFSCEEKRNTGFICWEIERLLAPDRN